MKALQDKIRIPQVTKYAEIDLVYKNKTYSEMIVMEYVPGSAIGVDMIYSKEEGKKIALVDWVH